MSTANLIQSLERVTSTINRQMNYQTDDSKSKEAFQSTRSPIQKFAERLEPAARSEIIKNLSREALFERANRDPSIEAFNLGTLGQDILTGDTDSAVNNLRLGQDYQTARVSRALGLAVNVAKVKVLDKLVAFSMRNSLDIPQKELSSMLNQISAKVIRENNYKKTRPEYSTQKNEAKALEMFETILAFKKSLNTVHTKDARKFTQATTKTINDNLTNLIEQGADHFANALGLLVAKLDTSYYDSSMDEVGLAKIEHAFSSKEAFEESQLISVLENKRTHQEESFQVESDDTAQVKAKKNTQSINEMVLKRMKSNPRGALNLLGQTLTSPQEKYDIRLDPHALEMINTQLPLIITNNKYSNQEKMKLLKEYRAILNTYAKTLDEANSSKI